jgi:hypothetical protein
MGKATIGLPRGESQPDWAALEALGMEHEVADPQLPQLRKPASVGDFPSMIPLAVVMFALPYRTAGSHTHRNHRIRARQARCPR